jgi:hypothetical protein
MNDFGWSPESNPNMTPAAGSTFYDRHVQLLGEGRRIPDRAWKNGIVRPVFASGPSSGDPAAIVAPCLGRVSLQSRSRFPGSLLSLDLFADRKCQVPARQERWRCASQVNASAGPAGMTA